ncbi:hypothetical protein Syun_017831 [Stephania yunnanensis]|uniref:Uncharacterized protein n=1 Tax=Stephania yunnanensis TaxID=152371 RepID=A0AAP0J7V3_9MAGN
MDEFIMETLEEQSLEAQLMDTTLTEALTENLIEREVEAIQHRVAVGLPPIESTDIENGGCEAAPIDSSEFERGFVRESALFLVVVAAAATTNKGCLRDNEVDDQSSNTGNFKEDAERLPQVSTPREHAILSEPINKSQQTCTDFKATTDSTVVRMDGLKETSPSSSMQPQVKIIARPMSCENERTSQSDASALSQLIEENSHLKHI